MTTVHKNRAVTTNSVILIVIVVLPMEITAAHRTLHQSLYGLIDLAFSGSRIAIASINSFS